MQAKTKKSVQISSGIHIEFAFLILEKFLILETIT